MSISMAFKLCERLCVNAGCQSWPVWLGAWLVAASGFSASAQPASAQTTNQAAGTNAPPPVEATQSQAEDAAPLLVEAPPSRAGSAPQKLDESAFAMIAERNIFNANRVGTVRLATRRPARIESFTLVGTMAYEKGAFAFFEGSSSEFTKVLKANSTIAGYKLADIYAGSVKLEADGKQIDLPIGSQMRREDAGAWKFMAEAANSNGEASSRSGNGDASSRFSRASESSRSRRGGDSSSRRSNTPEPAGKAPAAAAPTSAEQREILKKLMERREKE